MPDPKEFRSKDREIAKKMLREYFQKQGGKSYLRNAQQPSMSQDTETGEYIARPQLMKLGGKVPSYSKGGTVSGQADLYKMIESYMNGGKVTNYEDGGPVEGALPKNDAEAKAAGMEIDYSDPYRYLSDKQKEFIIKNEEHGVRVGRSQGESGGYLSPTDVNELMGLGNRAVLARARRVSDREGGDAAMAMNRSNNRAGYPSLQYNRSETFDEDFPEEDGKPRTQFAYQDPGMARAKTLGTTTNPNYVSMKQTRFGN